MSGAALNMLEGKIRIVETGSAYVVEVQGAINLALAAFGVPTSWEEVARFETASEARADVAAREAVAASVRRVVYESSLTFSLPVGVGQAPGK